MGRTRASLILWRYGIDWSLVALRVSMVHEFVSCSSIAQGEEKGNF